MLLRVTALVRIQHGLITRRQLRDSGFDDRQVKRLLKRGVLMPLRRGVYVERDRWDSLEPYREQPMLRIRAARLTLGGDYVLSHDSSSIVQHMGAPDPTRSLVHVTRTKVHGDAVRAGVKHHLAPFAPEQVLVVDGLAVLDPARTALDMAREHGLVAGVACCDAALRAGVTWSELEEARSRMWCWPYSTVMDEALLLADPGADSWLESEARVLVCGLGIGRPETQFGLTDCHRTAWCDLRVGRHFFEIDGALKYDDDNLTGRTPREVLLDEKQRHDFVTGFQARRVADHRLRLPGRAPGCRGAIAQGVPRHLRPVRHRHQRPRAVHRASSPLTHQPYQSHLPHPPRVARTCPAACNAGLPTVPTRSGPGG